MESKDKAWKQVIKKLHVNCYAVDCVHNVNGWCNRPGAAFPSIYISATRECMTFQARK